MAIVGGDAPALFHFASELRKRRSSIEATTRRLGALVEQANWSGPDREAFVREWHGQHAPSLMTVCQELGDAATKVAHHASDQEQASK